LDEDGTYRKSVWYNTTGEAFIPIAFRLAAKYDPHARLFCKSLTPHPSSHIPHNQHSTDNDYNLEANNAKTLGAKRIVKLIKSYGLRIDGVGYQAHISSESTPTSPEPAPNQTVLEQAFHATADEGVDVHISELDVRMNTPATAEKLEVQKQVYERVAKACLAVKRCVGMTVWVSGPFFFVVQ
jgi:endo-1,4-beta-xylanase